MSGYDLSQIGGYSEDSADTQRALLDWASQETPRQNAGLMGDLWTDLKRGVEELPGMVTGLGDIGYNAPTSALGLLHWAVGDAYGARPFDTAANWLGEKTGFQPAQWAKESEQEYSPRRQAANREINTAWDQAQWDDLASWAGVAGAYVTNPAATLGNVVESLPSIAAGGVVGRAARMGMGVQALEGLVAAGERAGASEAARLLGKEAAESLANRGALAAGLGEGVVTAGQAMNQTDRTVDAGLAARMALGAGLGTGLIGAGSGKLANWMGVGDIEQAMAGAATQRVGRSLPNRVALGAVQEGLLEELPQSMQEQVWQNLAEGKPWYAGVPRAGVEGLLAGGLMGSTFNLRRNNLQDSANPTSLLAPEQSAPTPETSQPTSGPEAPQPPATTATDIAIAGLQKFDIPSLQAVLKYGNPELRPVAEALLREKQAAAGMNTAAPVELVGATHGTDTTDSTPVVVTPGSAQTGNDLSGSATDLGPGGDGVADGRAAELPGLSPETAQQPSATPHAGEAGVTELVAPQQTAQPKAAPKPGTKPALQATVDGLYEQGSEEHTLLTEIIGSQNAKGKEKSYAQVRDDLIASGPAGLRVAIRTAKPQDAQIVQMRLGWDAEGNEVAAPMSLQQIATQLGLGKSTVKDALKRYEITEDVANRVVGADGATAKAKAATQQIEAPVTGTRADGTTEVVPATQEVPVPLTARGETTGANSILNQLLPTQGQDGEVGSLDDAGYSVLDSAGQSKVVEDSRTARETAETNKALAEMGVSPAELSQPSNFQTAADVRGEEVARANREAAAAAERAKAEQEARTAQEPTILKDHAGNLVPQVDIDDALAAWEDREGAALPRQYHNQWVRAWAANQDGVLNDKHFQEIYAGISEEIANGVPARIDRSEPVSRAAVGSDVRVDNGAPAETRATTGRDGDITAEGVIAEWNKGAAALKVAQWETLSTEQQDYLQGSGTWSEFDEAAQEVLAEINNVQFSELASTSNTVSYFTATPAETRFFKSGMFSTYLRDFLQDAGLSWWQRPDVSVFEGQIVVPSQDVKTMRAFAEWLADAPDSRSEIPPQMRGHTFLKALMSAKTGDAAQFSENQPAKGSKAPSITATLKKLFFSPAKFDQLVSIVQSLEALPARVKASVLSQAKNPQQVQGFVGEDGKVYLIADNIAPGAELAVFLHEVGVHLGMEKLIGKANMAALVNQINAWADKNDGSQESMLAQRAMQRAGNSSSENKQAEVVAYFVEEAVNAGVQPKMSANPVARWLANFQRWATSKINEWMGKPQNITARDLVQLAYGAAQMELAEQAPTPQQPMEKIGNSWYNDEVHLASGRQWGFSNGMQLLRYDVQDENGIVVGEVAIGERDGKPAELHVIKLADTQQGKGTGRKVMEALLASSNGELYIQNIVPGAVGFYDKLGVQWVTENKENGDAIYSQATAKARDTARDVVEDESRRGQDVRRASGAQGSAETDQAPRFSEAAVTPSQQESQGKLAKLGGVLDDLLADPKHFFKVHSLGWLTLEQLADRTKNVGVQAYAAVMNKLQRSAKDRIHKASEIYKGWEKLSDNVSDRLSKLMLDATRAQFDPDVEAPANDAQHALKSQFNALGKDAQQVYRQVRDYYKANNEARKAIMMEAAKNAPNKDKNLAEVEQLFATLKGPYFPLMRLGSHYVVAMSREAAELKAKVDNGTASDAEQKRFNELRKQKAHYTTSAFQSAGEARRAEKQLSKQYDTVYRSVAEENPVTQATLNHPEFKQVESYLSLSLDKDTANQVRELLSQLWFDSLPDRHPLKAQMKREGIHGEETDMRRVFAASAVRQAHYISRLENASDLSAAMTKTRELGRGDAMENRLVANELMKRNALAMQPSEGNLLVDTLRNASYFAHLGASPAFWLTNASQVPMITLPWLGARHGTARSTAAIWNAYKDVFHLIKTSYEKGGWHADFDWTGKIKGDEAKMLEYLRSRNLLDITMEHDLSAAGEMAPGKWGQRMNTAVNVMNIPVRATELANRAVTALAAYRLAMQTNPHNHQAAMEHAAKAVSTTQLDYSALNAPRHMQSVLGSKQLAQLMMQFRKYQQGMMYLVVTSFKDAIYAEGKTAEETKELRKQARNTLYGLFATTGLMAGSLGLPAAGTATFIASLLGGLGGDDDEPFDAEIAWRNFLTDLFGKDAALVLAKGLPAGLGMDLSKRVGMGDIASPLPFARKGKTGTETVANTLLAATGAPFGTVADTMDGMELFGKGQWLKGAEKIVPLKAASNAMRAIRYSTDGLTDKNGELILGDDKFSAADITLRALGFQPTKEAEYYAANQAVKQAQTAVMDTRAALIRQYAQAKVRGEDTGDIKDKIDEYNSRHGTKGQRIDMSSLLKAAQMRRKMAQERDETGVRLDKRTKPFAQSARFAIE